MQPVEILGFNSNPKQPIVSNLEMYLEKTKLFDAGPKVLKAFIKPHLAGSQDTVSRWVKAVLTEAGIDTTINRPTAHRTWTASTSAADSRGLLLSTNLVLKRKMLDRIVNIHSVSFIRVGTNRQVF